MRIWNKRCIMAFQLHFRHHKLLLQIVYRNPMFCAGEQIIFIELSVIYDYLMLIRDEQLIQKGHIFYLCIGCTSVALLFTHPTNGGYNIKVIMQQQETLQIGKSVFWVRQFCMQFDDLYILVIFPAFYSIMDLPLGNFFEVTVNSTKLASFFDQIQRKVQAQDSRIQEFMKNFHTVTSSLSNRLRKNEEFCGIELERVKKMGQEQSNFVRLFLKDADKKTHEKIEQFQATLSMINHRVSEIRDELKEDLSVKFSFFQKKIENSLSHQEISKIIQEQLTPCSKKQEELQTKLEERLNVLQNDFSKNKNDELSRLHIEDGQYDKGNSSFKCLSIKAHSRSKKRLKSHRKATIYESQDDIDRIVNKISQLQNKLQQQKQSKMVSNSRIVRINQTVSHIPIKSTVELQKKQQNKAEKLIQAKLSKIEEMLLNKFSEFQKSVGRIMNRHQIIEQQMGIVTRKMQKEKLKLGEMQLLMKKIQENEKKADDKALEGLKSSLKKLTKEFQESVDLKVGKQHYEKQRNKIHERLMVIQELLSEKVDKSQVKKGFSFLEEKIKEIIIVVAQQRNYNKDSATKKTHFKCLSCDKELDYSSEQMQTVPAKQFRDSTNNSARCSTSQLRKRIRVINAGPLMASDD